METLTMKAEVLRMQMQTNQFETFDGARLVQDSILSELPGLAFAVTTLVYIVASLALV